MKSTTTTMSSRTGFVVIIVLTISILFMINEFRVGFGLIKNHDVSENAIEEIERLKSETISSVWKISNQIMNASTYNSTTACICTDKDILESEIVTNLQKELKKVKMEKVALFTNQMKHVSDLQEEMKQMKNSFFSISRQEESEKERHEFLARHKEKYKNSTKYGGTPYVQEDHPLFNGVVLGDFTRNAIHKIYPKVDIDRCMDHYNDDTGRYVDTSGWFDIKQSINDVQHNKKLINFSLFKKLTKYPFGKIDNNERNEKWEEKYLKGMIEFFNINHPNSNAKQFHDCDFHLYLEKDLLYLIEDGVVPKHTNLTIHIMENNSIGAQPGMLWRFLGLNNPNYDVTAAVDIDRMITRIFF